MAFSLVQGGQAYDDRGLGADYGAIDGRDDSAPLPGAPDEEVDPDGLDEGAYRDAVLLNQRLKELVAQAWSQQPAAPAPDAGFAKPPLAPGRGRGPAPKESSSSINRKRFEQLVQVENASNARRMTERARSSSLVRAGASSAASSRESSQSINRRRFQERLRQENAGIASRLDRASSCDRVPKLQQQGGASKLPAGWTRGVGGRAMPPPKLRWGQGPSYDAGSWND
eukprot:TRINITY_DN11862_c0_g1_i1.p1 TRINITY_DN11862_c0_g1~~TRINITY_DN11862_c0_g1_i1.p1  ORF type:complete len:226 (+),score=56.30 TRINITY_DN11862_c0_g1_i1:63-740(+)